MNYQTLLQKPYNKVKKSKTKKICKRKTKITKITIYNNINFLIN